MATLEQLSAALVKADAAGNADDAKAFADEIRKMRAPAPAAPEKSMAENVVMGGLRGAKDVVDTGADWLSSVFSKSENQRVKAMNTEGTAAYEKDYGDSTAAKVARVGGNVAASWPVGGALGAGVKLAGATRVGNAIASGGFTTGAEVGAGLGARAADMGIRMAGGAINGGATAAVVDPQSAGTGAVVGGLLPPALAGAAKAGNAAGSLVRPFTNRGQERIVSDAVKQFSTNPAAARNIANAREIVPGSMPTSVAASGDEGLAGLSRTLQSTSPQYAAELSSRGASQNAARTAALEGIAGNTGKLAIAKEARDAATGPMREAVLDAAGKLPAAPVLASIDRLLAKPDNAGKMAQAALAEVRKRIGQFAPDGNIDARALYAIRKDINDTLGGKLQGEAGNLKLASGQLVQVKGLIDDAIDQASRAVTQSSGRAVMPAGANIERAGVSGPYGSMAPRPSWKQYLDEYTQQSIPINQMERLEEVLKAASTGTVDQSGNAVLSAAKLNNVLKNQGKELAKVLSPEQIETLRKIAADLNGSQLAANAGKAVGSNTVQNLGSANVLASVLGDKLAGSTGGQSMLNRLLQLPYGASNRMIQEKLGNALLNPQEMSRLLKEPGGNQLLKALGGPLALGGFFFVRRTHHGSSHRPHHLCRFG